ncbi:hypothetical protein EUX98_g4087 [Antrodiella citrinella]|uniref:Uncharacterized protein n=1 Tax=Antrodiella citrinella TaxID=2447956 RepID=A0A4S4MUW2_9APHY|nr:hypothetical protein EUX98_g4087 [Antrodiella citrinella]
MFPQYGVPGSGKTSLIHALAGELGMEVHQIELSRPNMNDQTLKKLFGGLPSRCIALLEDIDAVFPSRDGPRLDSDSSTSGRPDTETGSRVTLSGLLNTLDGIGAREGRLLFGTSNYASRLDPALRRSGRFDVYVEFKLASRYQGEELFKRFYTITDSDQIAKDEKTSDEGTVAELEDIKVDKADRLSPDVDVLPSCITPDSGKAAGDGESIERLEADTTAATTAKDTGSDDQANERSPDIDASPSSTNADPCQAAGDEKTEQVEATTADDTNADDEVNERSLGMPSSTASSTPTSTSSTLVTPPETASVLTIGGPVRCFAPEVIKSLATQFGDAIPERQLPMSDLQGYLMMHKGDPEAAVLHAAAWAKEELERKRNMGDIISQNEPQA